MYTVSVSGAALVIGTKQPLEFDVNDISDNIMFKDMGYELIPNGVN